MRILTLFFLALATTAGAAETVLPLWPEGVPGKRVAPSKSVLDRIGPKGNRAEHGVRPHLLSIAPKGGQKSRI